jgi:hypothetical protein
MLPEGWQSHHHRANALLKMVVEHGFLSQIIQKKNKCRLKQNERQINATKNQGIVFIPATFTFTLGMSINHWFCCRLSPRFKPHPSQNNFSYTVLDAINAFLGQNIPKICRIN